jgi:hypothetical protein
MLDHAAAQSVFQRLVAGEPPSPDDVASALAHTAGCEECRAQFDLGRTSACDAVEEDLPAAAQAVREGRSPADQYPAVARHLEECDRCRIVLSELVTEPEPEPAVAEPSIEPRERFFERVLTDGLADADAVARERAAERLADLQRIGPRALAALAEAARDDSEERVRKAALRALVRLDARVSLPERVIEAWAADPEVGAVFLRGVLARLADERVPVEGVTELVGGEAPGEERTAVTGSGGIRGRISEEADELKLSLEGLPRKFEHTKVVVAIPRVLEQDAPPIEWRGEPGLVAAEEDVRGGSVEMTLGRVVDDPGGAKGKLFDRLYLLGPEARRRRRRRT